MRLIVILALISTLVSLASANDGELTYQQKCAACHGAKGEGNAMMLSPALASQSAAYLKRQIAHYKNGLRGAHQDDQVAGVMVAFAASIGDSETSELSAYIATMPAIEVEGVDGDLARGEKYYQSYCGSCHGAQAEGNDALNSPKLSILSASYMQRQYDHFLNGVRGNLKQDKYGRQMALIASGMTDSSIITDMIAYITHIHEQ